jgi:hypothetical protein
MCFQILIMMTYHIKTKSSINPSPADLLDSNDFMRTSIP